VCRAVARSTRLACITLVLALHGLAAIASASDLVAVPAPVSVDVSVLEAVKAGGSVVDGYFLPNATLPQAEPQHTSTHAAESVAVASTEDDGTFAVVVDAVPGVFDAEHQLVSPAAPSSTASVVDQQLHSQQPQRPSQPPPASAAPSRTVPVTVRASVDRVRHSSPIVQPEMLPYINVSVQAAERAVWIVWVLSVATLTAICYYAFPWTFYLVA
jgi:hypothetical protein